MFRRLLLPLSWLLAVALLLATGPAPSVLTQPSDLTRQLAAAPDIALTQLAAGGAWLVLAWLAVGWLAVQGSRTRGRLGRTCRGFARVLLPTVLRRLLEGGVGLSVVLASTPALAASATPSVAVVADAQPRSLPSLDRSTTTQLQLAPLPAVPAPVLAAPPAAPDLVVRGQLPADAHAIVVRRGDCLWSVVARALGPDADDPAVARAWPRWYEANRSVIGDDPALLLPGQRLLPPAPTS